MKSIIILKGPTKDLVNFMITDEKDNLIEQCIVVKGNSDEKLGEFLDNYPTHELVDLQESME